MSISPKQYRYFLQLWLVALLAFLGLAATFNYLVDPYGLFNTNRINGFNVVKPAADSHVRLAKPYQVTSFGPRAVIGGNSRPEMGLNPANGCWPTALLPVFNLGLPGSSVYMQARTLQHAIAGNEVKLILWGLDFLDFLKLHDAVADPRLWPPARAGFEERLRVNADGSENKKYYWKRLEDNLTTLFSLDIMKDSLTTLFEQKNPHASTIRRDGFNPALDYLDIIAWEGQGVLFKQKNRTVARMFSRPGLKLFQGESDWSRDFESVRRFLQFALEHEVRVVLFINPYHAYYLILLELAGQWPKFALWKRQLAELAAEFEARLWDFSDINQLSTEQAPMLGDKKAILQWFWEPAHYRREYGDLMLSRMLQLSCDAGNTGPVGTLLTPENIGAHLIRLENDMMRYKDWNKAAIARLRGMIPEQGKTKSIGN